MTPPTTDDLVAPEQDSTEWYTGIGIAESVSDLVSGIESGDWVDIGLGGLTTGLEALSIAMDPIGSVASNLVSFIIEHVGPLQDMLDKLAGNADAVAAHAQTWRNIATEVGEVRADYDRDVGTDTSGWTGTAGDSYRGRARNTGELVGAASEAANGLGSAVEMAGVVVGVVRETVRDLIADLVGRLVVWAAEALTIVGAPAAAAQAATAAAKWAGRIAQVVKQLVRTIQNLIPLLRRLGDLFRQIQRKLDELTGRGDTPNDPDNPNDPNGGGDDPPDDPDDPPGTGGDGDHTQPSRDPDPNAEPGGHPTRIRDNDDAATRRSLERENESAQTLAQQGYDVEQNPTVEGDKNPDYRIEGQIFDNYAPSSGNARNIAANIQEKIDAGQTERVVLNLTDSSVSLDAMRNQLRDWPIEGLKEVIVIDADGNVLNFYP
ncbi:CdiA C-terminal domain-containing protein [Actinophytocola gossypii]|uniref:tRNA nuclease CdiA C-terminal domain-containing protein n=1 Tax=Actinophytocola gossypii TaxID=2812003 RepID=A0ABT2JK88_9PSEU|nr:hypothetical protein [Actinophytocola gossypii]MCT2587694.1 hypothetical protein [Actinophytocola gossypii]